MAAQAGKNVLLKLDTSGGSPQTYVTLTGQRVTNITVAGQTVDITSKDDNGWQQVLDQGGVRRLSVDVSGIFKDAAVDEVLRQAAFDNEIVWWQFAFPNGDTMEFQGKPENFQIGGEYDGAQTYSFTLQGHGTPLYTAAA
jgi:TP901-1 family phage major tail protein